MPFTKSRLLFAAVALPATTATLLLATYLHNHPLPASKSQTIKVINSIPPSHFASPSRKIVNPRNNQGLQDTRSIFLAAREIGALSDEEILARFAKGYFGGWMFAVELGMCKVADFFGTQLVKTGYSALEGNKELWSISDLSLQTLPPKQTLFFKGGSFMILNHHLSPASNQDGLGGESFLEVGYGDDRNSFSGMKRWSVERRLGEDGEKGVVLTDSSLACNPSVDRPIAPWAPRMLVRGFHNYYALCLFRDGVREVLELP